MANEAYVSCIWIHTPSSRELLSEKASVDKSEDPHAPAFEEEFMLHLQGNNALWQHPPWCFINQHCCR